VTVAESLSQILVEEKKEAFVFSPRLKNLTT
jgi:hypothetical protein